MKLIVLHVRLLSLLPLAGSALLAGCSGPGDPTVVVADSLGIPMVINSGRFDPAPGAIVDTASAVIVGRGDQQFNRPTAGALLDSGFFAVSDKGRTHIVLFDSTGTIAGYIGNAGAQDSLFNTVTWIGSCNGSTLLASDDRKRSVLTFDLHGNLLRSTPFPELNTSSFHSIAGCMTPSEVLILVTRLPSGTQGAQATDTVLIFRASSDSLHATRLMSVRGTERRMLGRLGVRLASIQIPFARRTIFAATDGMLHLTTNDSDTWMMLDRDGTVARYWKETAAEPLRVRDEELAAHNQRLVDMAPNLDLKAQVRSELHLAGASEEHPRFHTVIADRNGRFLLVRVRNADGPARSQWVIYSNIGERLGTIPLDPALEPLDLADGVLLALSPGVNAVDLVKRIRITYPH